MYTSKLSTILALTTLIVLSHAHVYSDVYSGEPIQCRHDELEFNPDVLDVDEGRERFLLTATSYPNIRIYPIYDTLTQGTDAFISYITNELIPPVVSLLQAALMIKYPLTSPLKVTQNTLCGIATPDSLLAGVDADFVILLSAQNTTGVSWVASASSCLVSSGVGRPLITSLKLNAAAITPVNMTHNPLYHEYNMYVIMHEIFHALGFSANFFNSYIDENGNLLKGHVKKVLLDGTNRTVLDLAPLTSRLRTFFGCPTLEGAFMEDDGGSGTTLSHWERRFFPFEFLSSGAIYSQKLTQFSLAFLEGTGWYAADYSYAEPYFYGQGAGCDFIRTTCNASATTTAFPDEYCVGNGRDCSEVGNTGGFCKSDICTDSCRFVSPQYEYHCENSNGVYYTAYSNKQVYGRGLGSKCFSGNLTTGKTSVLQTTYCFKYNCVGQGVDTTLQVSFGTTTLTCQQQGPLSVPGYNGQINCPDPLQFCSTIGQPYCPRGCSGRGHCVNNICVCDPGFQGVDCAFTA